jgi:hypothetical protein
MVVGGQPTRAVSRVSPSCRHAERANELTIVIQGKRYAIRFACLQDIEPSATDGSRDGVQVVDQTASLSVASICVAYLCVSTHPGRQASCRMECLGILYYGIRDSQ